MEWIQTLATVLGASATAIAAAMAARSAKDSHISATAAADSASATHRLISLTDRHFQLSQRAYVWINDVQIERSSEDGKPVRFSLQFRNSGSSPAHSAIIRDKAQLFNNPVSEVPPLESVPDDSRFSVAPGAQFNVTKELSWLTAADGNAVLADRAFLYYFGDVTYNDIFGCEHKSAWCFVYKNAHRPLLIPEPFHNFME